MAAMVKLPRLSHGRRFFSVFQRYMSLTSSTHFQFYNRRSLPSYRSEHQSHQTKSVRPYASAAAAHAPGLTTTQQPDTPVLYNLFPETLPDGPPPNGQFAVDTRQLRKEFLQLQARAHPDRHSGPDKAKAEGTSALINEAYKTLQDPLRRAQYLLSLRGIDVAEDERLTVEDPELLMEVLEVREAIEAAQEEGELDEMKANNDRNIKESETILDQAFGLENIESAKDEAVRLRYWTNIKESLDAWEKGKPVVLVH